MSIFDYIATVDFDKEDFFILIDCDGRLDSEARQHFWDEFAMYSKQNLITFYRSLQDAPIPEYVKQSMNLFFYRKTFELLDERFGF